MVNRDCDWLSFSSHFSFSLKLISAFLLSFGMIMLREGDRLARTGETDEGEKTAGGR